MMTRINILLVILLLLLSSLACIVPFVSETGRTFINKFVDLEGKTPVPAQPAIPAPANNSTTNNNIAQDSRNL